MVKIKNIFTAFVLIYMTNVNISSETIKIVNTIEIIQGSQTTQIISSVIYFVVLCLIIIRWRYSVRISANNILIWIVVFWVFSSFLWSGEPALTLRRAAALLGTVLTGLYIASFYKLDQFARITGWTFLTMSILSLLMIIFFPSLGVKYDPPGWGGIYAYKNTLGQNSFFGIIVFLCLLGEKGKRKYWVFGLILSCILLVGSQSVTSILVAIMAFYLWSVMFALQNRKRTFFILLIFLLLFTLIIGIWLLFTKNFDIVFNILGKDSSFNGRTSIWIAVINVIKQSPWLGYGYGAVWLGRDYGPIASIYQSIDWFAVGAHNGYLDLCLQIGLIGTIIVCFYYINLVLKWIYILVKTRRISNYQLWPLVFLFSFVTYNLVEVNLLDQTSISLVFVTVFSFSIFSIENHLNEFI